MGTNLVFNKGESQTIDGPVRSIEVQAGEIVVTRPRVEEPDHDTPPPESVTVETGGTFNGCDQAGLMITDVAGSRVQITYTDDAIADGRPDEADAAGAPNTRARAKRRSRRKTASSESVETSTQDKADAELGKSTKGRAERGQQKKAAPAKKKTSSSKKKTSSSSSRKSSSRKKK